MNSTPDAAFFALATVLTLAGLWRELPLQYVLTVAAVTFGISALGYWVLKESLWWLPLIVLNGRGVSRYVLYKWRDRRYYGWWVIGLTCVLPLVLVWEWDALALGFLMQLAALPWLIKRRPGKDRPNWFPLLNWLLIGAWILIRN